MLTSGAFNVNLDIYCNYLLLAPQQQSTESLHIPQLLYLHKLLSVLFEKLLFKLLLGKI